MSHYLPLIGILILVLGFALRLNPMLVATAAVLTSGLLGGMTLQQVIAEFGKAFNDNRIIAVVWIILPVIGLLERYGLQERARTLIARLRNATVGKLLIIYLLYRQLTAAIGLHNTAGHAQTVNPIVAPMALVAAEKQQGPLDDDMVQRVKSVTAATDNVGLFFGEDIFFAIGSIVVIQQALAARHVELSPVELSLWAIPTAVAAFIVHSTRLFLFDRKLRRAAP
jgi:uncharacterized membrane protein